MESTPPAVSVKLRTDERLLDLLRTEGDRLPREAVDEILSRGPRLFGLLASIVSDPASWAVSPPWPAIHATFVLGATGSEEAVPPLLESMRHATARRVDLVWKALPGMFGTLGRPAIAPLRTRVGDRSLSPGERTVSVHALGGVAAWHPIEQGEILDFLRAVVEDAGETGWIRSVAALVLLRFARPGDRAAVLNEALRQRKEGRRPLFTMMEAREVFGRGTQNLRPYHGDWMAFYSERAFEARDRDRRDAEEDAEWARAADEGAGWVQRVLGQFLGKYEGVLSGFEEGERAEAVRVAESMTEYLVGHERRAPWRWNGETVFSFLMDCFVRRVSLDDDAQIHAVPDHVIRFVRFCEAEGRVTPERLREAERRVESERADFLAAATDPERRSRARRALDKLLLKGVDLCDTRALESLEK